MQPSRHQFERAATSMADRALLALIAAVLAVANPAIMNRPAALDATAAASSAVSGSQDPGRPAPGLDGELVHEVQARGTHPPRSAS